MNTLAHGEASSYRSFLESGDRKGILAWILATLLIKGIGALNLAVFTQMTPPPGEDGGLLNAIVGSLLMVGVGVLIAVPVGVMAGIYLAEYGRRGWLTPVTRFVNDILLSAPSIVLGLFIYAIYVATVKHFSGWAGSMALALSSRVPTCCSRTAI